MYMRNKSKYANYNIDDFPPNYSGQYTKESLRNNIENEDTKIHIDRNDKYDKYDRCDKNDINNKNIIKDDVKEEKPDKSEKNEKRSNSLLGNLFGGNKDKDGKEGRGGLLSGLFRGGDSKTGGIFSGIEFEDLILLAVIFFLLKDGVEDDLIIILAIILLSQ